MQQGDIVKASNQLGRSLLKEGLLKDIDWIPHMIHLFLTLLMIIIKMVTEKLRARC